MEDYQKALLLGLLCLGVGASGWVLPYRWNVLRLRSSLARRVPQSVNQAIPRIVGSFLIFGGVLLQAGGAFLGLGGMEWVESAVVSAAARVTSCLQSLAQRDPAAAAAEADLLRVVTPLDPELAELAEALRISGRAGAGRGDG